MVSEYLSKNVRRCWNRTSCRSEKLMFARFGLRSVDTGTRFSQGNHFGSAALVYPPNLRLWSLGELKTVRCLIDHCWCSRLKQVDSNASIIAFFYVLIMPSYGGDSELPRSSSAGRKLRPTNKLTRPDGLAIENTNLGLAVRRASNKMRAKLSMARQRKIVVLGVVADLERFKIADVDDEYKIQLSKLFFDIT